MSFVVEGKAYWAFTYKPFKLAEENYQLMLAPDAETVAKFEKQGHRVVDIKINHEQTVKGESMGSLISITRIKKESTWMKRSPMELKSKLSLMTGK